MEEAGHQALAPDKAAVKAARYGLRRYVMMVLHL
jgi:hypothetical protein